MGVLSIISRDIRGFWQERRGNVSVEFAAVAIILAFTALAFAEPIKLGRINDNLTALAQSAITHAEAEQGITPQLVQAIQDKAQSIGLDGSQLVVNGTPAPQNYGTEIWVQLEYPVRYNHVTINNWLIASMAQEVTLRSPILYGVSLRHTR